MSGKRNQKPDDIIKNRQEYLDNLNLEIQLQDSNEQAVKQFKETGQLPPATQMKDNRTVEDKLRDFEKLKLSIKEDLEPIASPQLANMIIQYILNFIKFIFQFFSYLILNWIYIYYFLCKNIRFYFI